MVSNKDNPSKNKPSRPFQELVSKLPPLPPEEIERRRLGAQRLKERLGHIPHYAKAAEKDPNYWEKFYASRVLSED